VHACVGTEGVVHFIVLPLCRARRPMHVSTPPRWQDGRADGRTGARTDGRAGGRTDGRARRDARKLRAQSLFPRTFFAQLRRKRRTRSGAIKPSKCRRGGLGSSAVFDMLSTWVSRGARNIRSWTLFLGVRGAVGVQERRKFSRNHMPPVRNGIRVLAWSLIRVLPFRLMAC
jgi:hypothetical protein